MSPYSTRPRTEKSRIQLRLQDGTVWLNQRLQAELYQVFMRRPYQ